MIRQGGPRAAALILVMGGAVTGVLGLVLGLLARSVQASFDAPLYDVLVAAYSPGSTWTRLNEAFTVIGDPLPSLWQSLAAAAVFAVLFRARWWIPAVLMPLGFVIEYVMQQGLTYLVARGAPPQGIGTWFSGGSARFVVMYGLILFLITLRWPGISRAWRIVGVISVAVLSFVEGYTRLYLLMHWPTDIPGGWLIGTLLLGTLIASTLALVGPAPVGAGRDEPHRMA
ncbi:MAG: phosphatase PAP2 family protein [Chloroflexi bacterium]|nr:phosphatase PAP2 family protein [Chloroflexota bacterium]